MFELPSLPRRPQSLTLLSVAVLCSVLCAGQSARAQVRDAPALSFGQTSELAQNATGVSIALASGQSNVFDQRQETLNLNAASVDDALLAVGDAANLTVLMDARDPQAGAPFSTGGPTPLRLVWPRIMQRFHLSTLQPNTQTLLVWNSPPPEAVLRVAKQVANTQDGARPGAVISAPDKVPPYLWKSPNLQEVANAPADPLLTDLLIQLRIQGIADAPSFSKNLPVSDLPEALRARIVARVQALAAISAPTPGKWSQPNWKAARLKMSRPLNADRTNPAYLWVEGAFAGISLAIPAIEYPAATAPAIQNGENQPVLLEAGTQAIEGGTAKAIHLRARRAPLEDVLREMERQSGVPLRLEAPVAALGAKVTARVQGIALDNVLASLARLYGLRWDRAGDGARVASLVVTDPDFRLMLRLGSSRGALRDALRALDGRDGVSLLGAPNLGVRAVKEIGEGVLLQAGEKGVPFTALSSDSQQEVSARVQASAALRVLEQKQGLNNANWNEATLHVQNAPLCLTDPSTSSLVATLQLPQGLQILIAAPPESTQFEGIWNGLPDATKDSVIESVQRHRGAALAIRQVATEPRQRGAERRGAA